MSLSICIHLLEFIMDTGPCLTPAQSGTITMYSNFILIRWCLGQLFVP